MDLADSIAIPTAALSVGRALAAAGHGAILVGGAVRDGLLGTPGAPDLDLATDATPEQVRTALAGAPGVRSVYALGERFGTVGVALDDGTVLEITTLRVDTGSLPQRFAADAALRDFTVNAMGLDLATNTLLDPLDGREDLAAGVLRAPGTPAERFADDPIRVLRAARFVAQLRFALDPATASAMPPFAPHLSDVAVERIRDELTKLLVAPHAAAGLEVLHASGGLAGVLPEVAALDGVSQPRFHDLDALAHTIQTVAVVPATRTLRWAALLHDTGKAPTRTVDPDGRIRFLGHAQESARIAQQIATRLRFSNADRGAIVHLVGEHMRLGELHVTNPRAVDRAVRRLDLWERGSAAGAPLVTAEDALELTLADFSATAHRDEAAAVRAQLEDAVAASRARGTRTEPRSPLSGDELMGALGLEQGPAVGVATRAILCALETGALAADDRAGALEIARRALAGSR
jgi:poly(A) polymerase